MQELRCRNPDSNSHPDRWLLHGVSSGSEGALELATPQDELVAVILGKTLDRLTLESARRAAGDRQDEGIYGVFLMHEYFGMFSTVVFTERELCAACKTHPEEPPGSVRWAIWWPSTTHLDEPELKRAVDALELQLRSMSSGERDRLVQEVERLCLVALRRVRMAGVLDASVVLALGAVEQSAEETYLCAEQLCDPETLGRFRRELAEINEATLELFRGKVARL